MSEDMAELRVGELVHLGGSSIRPTVGFQPSEAFSAVIRVAMTWPDTFSNGSRYGMSGVDMKRATESSSGSRVRSMPLATIS
eukprot:scaffold15489_cov23-Tisochrysis_lutea.AAC.1